MSATPEEELCTAVHSSEDTMSVWDAARALDMPVGQVYALCEVGTLAYVRPGRQILVLRTAVELLDAPA